MSFRLRAGQPTTRSSMTTGWPGDIASTSTPNIGRVVLARYWSLCDFGSVLPSSEMKRRTRPSSGCALRAAGNEIAKRSGAAVCARVAITAGAARATDTAIATEIGCATRYGTCFTRDI
jgi:hypothetical protein